LLIQAQLEKRIIVLDRDGVINQDSDAYIKSPDEWIPVAGSIEAIAKLYHHGFRLFVITNQSGVARGYYGLETLHQIHRKMHDYVDRAGGKIEGILFCPHGPEDGCTCRKPKAGLFEQLQTTLNIPLDGVPAIGDSWRDIQAAQAVGALPILVKSGKGEQTMREHAAELDVMPVYQNLLQVVDEFILKT